VQQPPSNSGVSLATRGAPPFRALRVARSVGRGSRRGRKGGARIHDPTYSAESIYPGVERSRIGWAIPMRLPSLS